MEIVFGRFKEDHRDMQIHSVGIDLGKTTFHLVALSAAGKVLLRRKFTQKQLITFTANMQIMKLPGSTLIPCKNQMAPARTKRPAAIFCVILTPVPKLRNLPINQRRSKIHRNASIAPPLSHEQFPFLMSASAVVARKSTRAPRTRW